MSRNTRSAFIIFKKTKKKRLLFTACITLSVLSLTLVGVMNLTANYARKAHAASNNQVYPAPITEFSTTTTNSWPDGITTGPDHNLWFTEYNTDKIGRVTPSGGLTEFSIPTTTGSYVEPTGITTGSDGNLWFTDRSGGFIGQVTPQGKITKFPYSYTSPQPGTITAGPDKNLWFVDYSGWIVRMTPQGKATEFPIPSSAINPGSITVGPDGNLWFTAISQIGRITPTGAIKVFSLNSPYAFPGGITAGPDGNLWFSEYNSSGSAIGRITPKGVITDFPVPTITYPDNTTWSVNPSYMTAGPDGNLWFTSDAQALGQITPSGVVTEYISQNASSFGGGISPNGLTAGPDGNVWFADYGLNKVGYLSLGGTNPTPTPTPTPLSALCPTGTTLSGTSWIAQFPDSKSTGTLVQPFRDHVNSFITALKNAGAAVTITQTYRPPQRAYLMYYAYKIAKKGLDPRKVPTMAGVPICWLYAKADGSFDLALSQKAAAQMVTAYKIVYQPALASNHTKGLAIDMNISWSGTLQITEANGTVVKITTSPKSGMNSTLWTVGTTYQVFKLATDPPHWSYNGH